MRCALVSTSLPHHRECVSASFAICAMKMGWTYSDKRENLLTALLTNYQSEKKRLEIFQMRMLEPRFAILDETDSGLDIDALRTVAESRLRVPQLRANHTWQLRRHPPFRSPSP